jgi:flavodoxin
MNIQIITGSMTGNADRIATQAAELLSAQGHQVRINNRFSPQDLDNDDLLLLCHSNTGAGDLPDNILPLYLHLARDFPRIAGRRYGVINLGDSSYTSFNEAGVLLDAAMQDLGAVKLGESLIFDASEDEDTDAQLRDWIATFSSLI